jgi:hypothetical protein
MPLALRLNDQLGLTAFESALCHCVQLRQQIRKVSFLKLPDHRDALLVGSRCLEPEQGRSVELRVSGNACMGNGVSQMAEQVSSLRLSSHKDEEVELVVVQESLESLVKFLRCHARDGERH